ncbi:ABC transporter ATP-binding protein [Stutzerimonas stutzeri]|nr:ABC transporter ATP-binding protein [Stutzerimonas stutzeri]MDH0101604.1 ABC transporter ATP-binding protein [Stutzerimonas stutzeri]
MFSEIAISAKGLSKSYHIYDTPRDRLKQFVFAGARRMLGMKPKNYFRDFSALHDVSFSIGRGETVGIIGRNGSGKSTLLQIICGTLTPTNGSVETYGRISALLELGSGFNPEFTGRENVYLNASILGLSEREIDERYKDIVDFANIGSFIDQPIKTYSSGMVVRLAFATAIHVEPDILVVDEALSVGDVAFQQKCLSRIREMQRRGVAILLVTHSSNTLIEYCDRGIFLKHGQLVLDGPCRDVVKRYADDLVQDEGGATSSEIEKPWQNSPAIEDISESAPVIDSCAISEALPLSPMVIESVRLIDDSGATCAAVKHGDVVRVAVGVRVSQSIIDPCFGIQISSLDGITLWSAATNSMGIALPSFDEGLHEIYWDLTANFSGNRYVVAIGVGQIISGEYKRHHRLDYACHFDVLSIPHSGGGWLAPLPLFSVSGK